MQVIARAPARVSLVGGGTDLPAYYERFGGAVVSFTVGTYAYAQASPHPTGLELVSHDTGQRELIASRNVARRVRPPILAEEFLVYQKAVAWHFGIDRGRLACASEVPPGAGMASSGSICVALVTAATAFLGEPIDKEAIAETACRIEMHVLSRGAGKQDPYASAFGGLNLLEFLPDGTVGVTPLAVSRTTAMVLDRRIMLFGNGARRSAVGPLLEQARRSSSDPETIAALGKLKEMAFEMREVLELGNLERVGTLLDEAWTAKQRLNSQVSTPEIARVYSLAKRAGATGGKLAGAGLAGTLVLYCPEEHQDEVRQVLGTQGWRERPVSLDWEGAMLCDEPGSEVDRFRA